MAKISVIVPVYKVEPYLKKCADSILNQTFSDFDLILVDDGSPDHCGSICDEFAQRDPRVHVLHQKNGGLSAARNSGLDFVCTHCESEWVTFIDSDDWIESNYLELLYDAAEKYSVNVALCILSYTDGRKLNTGNMGVESELISPEDLYVNYGLYAIWAAGKLFRKSMVEKVRFPLGRLHEDRYTTHKILYECENVVWVKKPLYNYYQHSGSILGSQWSRRRLDDIKAFKMQIAYFDVHGFGRAYHHAIMEFIQWLIVGGRRAFATCADDFRQRKILRGELQKMSSFARGHHCLNLKQYGLCMRLRWRVYLLTHCDLAFIVDKHNVKTILRECFRMK